MLKNTILCTLQATGAFIHPSATGVFCAPFQSQKDFQPSHNQKESIHIQDDFTMIRRFLLTLQRQGGFYSPFYDEEGFIHPSPTRRNYSPFSDQDGFIHPSLTRRVLFTLP